MNPQFSRLVPSGAFLLCLAAPGLALAQQSPPPDTPLSPVVVTADRIPTSLDQVASSITLITAADIDAGQWRTLPDVLQAVAGLSVVQTGGPGGQTSVFIRGANANQTKVIIDGVEVNDPSEGAFDFGRLQTIGVDSVEVLRGPQSSLYGADALGGVISIVTREGQGRPRLDASLEGGSFDTLDESAAASGSTGRLSWAADVAHLFSGDTPVTPLDLLSPGERRIGDRHDSLTLGTKLGWTLSPEASLHLVVRYSREDLKFTGENYDLYPAPNAPDAAQSDQRSRQLFARAEARFGLFGGALNNSLGLGYTDDQTLTQSPDDGYGLPAPVLAAGNRLKVDYQGTLALDARDTLVLGAEDQEDRLLASPVDARDGERAGWLELVSRPVRGVSLAASVRYDSDDRFGDYATWRIAPTWVIAATGTQLRATLGTGFKAPTLTDLFVSYPAYGYRANARLRPETSQGYDIGFEQPLASGRLRFGATWYHQVIKGLIEDNLDYTTEINLGRATTYGVESFISAAVSRVLTVRADYTYTIARDDMAGQELLRRPKDKASLAASWKASRRLTLTGSLLYVGAWVDGNRDFSVPRLPASPYATVNLAGSYDIGHGVSLFARLNNLLDRHYQDPVGYDRPGMGAFGGVKISLP